LDAGSSWPSAEASRSYTKLAMSLNKVVRAGVSGPTGRRQHGSLAEWCLGSAARKCDSVVSFSQRIKPQCREEVRCDGAYQQLSGCLPEDLAWTGRQDAEFGGRAVPPCSARMSGNKGWTDQSGYTAGDCSAAFGIEMVRMQGVAASLVLCRRWCRVGGSDALMAVASRDPCCLFLVGPAGLNSEWQRAQRTTGPSQGTQATEARRP
jgi:hypothetical protein